MNHFTDSPLPIDHTGLPVNHKDRVLRWFRGHGADILEWDPNDEDSDGIDPGSPAGQCGVVQMFVGERQLFVGDPTITGPWEVEVAALLREGMPYEVEVIVRDLWDYATTANTRHHLEFVDDDPDTGTAVWLFLLLGEDETTPEALDQLIPEFLSEIDRATPLLYG